MSGFISLSSIKEKEKEKKRKERKEKEKKKKRIFKNKQIMKTCA